MNKQEYEQKFTSILKQDIMEKGYFKTGSLFNSIKVVISESTGKVTIKYSSKDYIKYLNDGNFYKDFFKSNALKQLVLKFTLDIIKNKLINNGNNNS